MGLDYNWTCGKIDDNIKSFKEILDIETDTLLDEVCPLFEGDVKKDFITNWVNSVYQEVEGIFEDLRDCNSDLRGAADKQIDDLEEEKQDLINDNETKQDQIDDLETKVEELETEKYVLQEEVRALKNKIEELEN